MNEDDENDDDDAAHTQLTDINTIFHVSYGVPCYILYTTHTYR